MAQQVSAQQNPSPGVTIPSVWRQVLRERKERTSHSSFFISRFPPILRYLTDIPQHSLASLLSDG